jgi:hypothetical protein
MATCQLLESSLKLLQELLVQGVYFTMTHIGQKSSLVNAERHTTAAVHSHTSHNLKVCLQLPYI